MDLADVVIEDSTSLVAVVMLLDAETGYVVAADSKAVDYRSDATGVVLPTHAGASWPADVYNLQGRCVRRNATDLETLPKGVYVVGGKKIVR